MAMEKALFEAGIKKWLAADVGAFLRYFEG